MSPCQNRTPIVLLFCAEFPVATRATYLCSQWMILNTRSQFEQRRRQSLLYINFVDRVGFAGHFAARSSNLSGTICGALHCGTELQVAMGSEVRCNQLILVTA